MERTGQAYIASAVGIAEGWHYNGPGYTTPNGWYDGMQLDAFHLDALAAQLVRQVDETPCEVTADSYEVCVYPPYGAALSGFNGEDRTMNTIKAIVDSGVLSQPSSGENDA